MVDQDINGFIVYVIMLVYVGVFIVVEKDIIIDGLEVIWEEIYNGEFEWFVVLEDVYMNIEVCFM